MKTNMFSDYPDMVTIKDLGEMLAIGRTTAYQLIKDGKIPYLQNGRRILLPKLCVIDYLGFADYIDNEEKMKLECIKNMLYK